MSKQKLEEFNVIFKKLLTCLGYTLIICILVRAFMPTEFKIEVEHKVTSFPMYSPFVIEHRNR